MAPDRRENSELYPLPHCNRAGIVRLSRLRAPAANRSVWAEPPASGPERWSQSNGARAVGPDQL